MTSRLPKNRPPTHPGEMLVEEFITPSGLTQQEIANRLGISYPRLNELVHGKRGMTPDTALRLERLFGMDAEFWLKLQLLWDLYQAKQAPATAGSLEGIQALDLRKGVDRTLAAGLRRDKKATAER